MTRVGLIYLGLVTAIYLVCFRISPSRSRQSLSVSRQTFGRMLPLLAAIFGLIGLFEVFIPRDLIQQWLGAGSGAWSLLAGGLAGAVAIGPPVAAFPLAGSFLAAGAWPPAAAAFIVSWVSVGIFTLPFEAHVFGWRFAFFRNLFTFIAALLIGLALGGLL